MKPTLKIVVAAILFTIAGSTAAYAQDATNYINSNNNSLGMVLVGSLAFIVLLTAFIYCNAFNKSPED